MNQYLSDCSINEENYDIAIPVIAWLMNRYCSDLFMRYGRWEYTELHLCHISSLSASFQYNYDRWISINPNEITKLKEDWVIQRDINISIIIAHEFWHHLSHLLWLDLDQWQEEVFADKFAWYILKRMNDDGYLDNECRDMISVLSGMEKLWNLDEERRGIMNYHWNWSERMWRINDWFSWNFEDSLEKYRDNLLAKLT